MTTNKTQRSPDYDLEMVKKYLETFPDPSVGSMNAFRAPSAWADEWEAFLKESWKYKLKVLRNAIPDHNLILDGLKVLGLKKLYPEEMDEPIELEPCEVLSISEVKPYDEFVRFRCMHCMEEWVFDKSDFWAKPRKCDCDQSHIVETTNISKDSVSSQWVKIAELQNEGSEVRESISCLLKTKEMMWSIEFHERVSMIGILTFQKSRSPTLTGHNDYVRIFEVYGVRKVDPEARIPLSDRDIAYIQAEQKKPDFLDRLVKSFAPHIWGMEPFKEAILLVLASMKLPRPARLLMVTDPSMGKSELIDYTCTYVIRNAQHTQMGRSSAAGLTLTTEKDEETGRRYVIRGAAAAAHRGLLCIDELQMGEAKDFMKLNDLLESGKVRYAMAGVRGQMNANCAMILACNPHSGRFAGDEQSLGEILEFMGNDLPQFVSRMNLILMKRDNHTEEEHRAIAGHMLDHNIQDPLYMSRYEENWYDENDIEEVAFQTPIMGFTIIVKGPAPRYGTKFIRKIIKYVTNNVPVEQMSEQYQNTLLEYYMRNRTDVATRVNKLMTLRFLRHGIVLAQYMARLQGKSKPDGDDVTRAMRLLEKSMSVAAFDPKTKDLDVNMFNGNFSKEKLERDSALTKAQQFEEAVNKAIKDRDYFTIDDLEFHLNMIPNSKWKIGARLDDSAIEKEVQKRCRFGQLYEKHGQGKYTPV